MKLWKLLFLLSGLIAGVVLGVWALQGNNLEAAPQATTDPIPADLVSAGFELTDLNGNTWNLDDLRGKVVIINFWATWCPPCKDEMPLLDETARNYPDDLVVLGIDYQEEQDLVQQFVEKNVISFPILLDTEGEVTQDYFVRSFPTTYFLDREGVIRSLHLGPLSEKLIREYLGKVGIPQ